MEKSQNKNKITALGTGTSTGIPMVGCSCSVCTSLDHRDQRLRTSLYLSTRKGQNILVDTTPDLRTQLLVNKISSVDFAIITHDHADHLHGIDDLRPFTFGPPPKYIPLYANAATKTSIEKRFPYIFAPQTKTPLGGGIPRLTIEAVPLEKKVVIGQEEFIFFNYPHGHGETMGFIHDSSFAYIVDCMELSEAVLDWLASFQLQLLVIDCLKRSSHATHLTVEKSFGYIKRIKPLRTGLIHMGHDLSHTLLSELARKEFGPSVFPLYDEQKLYY